MTTAALIVAAGRGVRAGEGPPKQYRRVGGEAVLTHALRSLLSAPGVDLAQVVIHPDDEAVYAEAAAPLAASLAPALAPARLLSPVPGGADRQASTLAGLEALAAAAPDRVLIHDAARPFPPPALVARVIAALDAHDGACPALPVVDALRRAEDDLAAAAVDRAGLVRAQTPQGFRFAPILAAHRAAAGAGLPDDVEVARAAGLEVALTPGDEAAFKITTPEDFARAEAWLAAQEAAMETRTGTGFDVHRFGPGAEVTLCGVPVPHDCGLSGHSDADVGIHALTDAIFGALAEGDIGRWFPPSDPQWKGAESAIFLEKAVERVAARGGRVVNVDVTLICERPKIGPHAEAMRARLAALLGVEPGRVGVKATTTERLGFAGRGEGIAAQAVATLRLPA